MTTAGRCSIALLVLLVPSVLLGEPAHEKVGVCHLPGESAANGNKVDVGSEGALLAHLAHGDTAFGTGMDANCDGGFQVQVDPNLEPVVPQLEGVRGGPLRNVAAVAVAGGDDRASSFVLGEVQLKVHDEAHLLELLARYGGAILYDDTLVIGDESGQPVEIPAGGDGWYLVQVDLARSSLLDLAANAAVAGYEATWIVSSLDAARAIALTLREGDLEISLNYVAQLDTAVLEHPDDDGGFIDFNDPAAFFVSNNHTEENDSGHSLSIGVAHAWEYLEHTGVTPVPLGVPPGEDPPDPVRIAVLDDGFNLSTITGLGGRDYPTFFTPPLQTDTLDDDARAGGPGPDYLEELARWHGELSFGSCCARSNNQFGTASSGGNFVIPILVRVDPTDYGMAKAYRAAIRMGADVITSSMGFYCYDYCKDEGTRNLQAAVDSAIASGAVVFNSAGNEGVDLATYLTGDAIPCELDGVICVGGATHTIGPTGAFDIRGNFGHAVDIAGPYQHQSAPTPVATGRDSDDVGVDELSLYTGTSNAAPFVAGIAGMMKAADRSLSRFQIESLLQATANCVPDRPVSPCPFTPIPEMINGYVDAYRAVAAVRPNPAPQVRIVDPIGGGSVSWNADDVVIARIDDPPAPGNFSGRVAVRSSLDGDLCAEDFEGFRFQCFGDLETLGTHTIRVSATDAFGATGSDAVELTLTNSAPILTILSPLDAATLFSAQPVTFRTSVRDPDGEIPRLRWTSSLDGTIRNTAPATFTTTLSPGTHVLTAEAEDHFTVTSQSITVTVMAGGDELPFARIDEPMNDFRVIAGETFTLRGTGTDPQDGVLPNASFSWSDEFNGFLGTGSVLEVTYGGEDCQGQERVTITLTVTDSDGNVATDSVTIIFGRVC